MKLLALDTATDACSVALWLDGDVRERFELDVRHGERLLPMVDALLADAQLTLAQLDGIAFGRGPGSFTGLRIGAGVAQGLAFGADLPVVPVSSLAALAQGVDALKVLAVFDARMRQVYYGAYLKNAQGMVELQGAEIVVAPGAVPSPEGRDWTGAGSGWDAYHDALDAKLATAHRGWIAGAHPHARDLARIGAAEFSARRTTPELALPVYLRDDVAVKRKRD